MVEKIIDLNQVVQEVSKLLRSIIGENIELKTSLHKGYLTIKADPHHMEQVLMNLATNARDAMPNDGELSITTDIIDLDETYIEQFGYGNVGTFARMTVSDTGTGISKENQNKIYEPFFTTKEVGKGTGLGLSIVYGIIKQHKGYINVYSEPNKGTTFKIYLPYVEAAVDQEPPIIPSYSDEALYGKESILVIEDDEMAKITICKILKKFGYTYYEAGDGERGLELFRKHKDTIAMAIIDVIMPKKNGPDVYQEMKQIKPDLKALFVSGYTSDAFGDAFNPENHLELMSKPFDPYMLAKKIREIINGAAKQ